MARSIQQSTKGLSFRADQQHAVTRALPEEIPVALVYDGSTQAVMMATPQDLTDFAYGFSLTEGIVTSLDQILEIEIEDHEQGIEARMWLDPTRSEALKSRRRSMVGPVGCGLCGIDSLSEALRTLPPIASAPLVLSARQVAEMSEQLRQHQPLHDQTHAVHAAGFYHPDTGITVAREDVGRHNALDKLVGVMAREQVDASKGAVVLTSRISVDMVQKCAVAGVPVLVAVSAPTALAVRVAEEAGITLAAFARGTGFDIYSHPQRVSNGESNVA